MKLILSLCLALTFAAALQAQTSTNCTAGGYCGNSQSATGYSNAGYSTPVGLPFAFASSTMQVTALKDYIWGTPPSSGTWIALLVCDSNTSGATIGNSSPCPSHNVVCSATGANSSLTTGTNSFAVSGCGTLSTSARYWVFFSNSVSTSYGVVTGGKNGVYTTVFSCCTIPSSVTGSMTTGWSAASFGVNVTLPATNVANPDAIAMSP